MILLKIRVYYQRVGHFVVLGVEMLQLSQHYQITQKQFLLHLIWEGVTLKKNSIRS